MAAYFFGEITLEYEGLSFDDFLKIWLEEANAVLAIQEKMPSFHIWKIVGERRLVFVLQSTHDGLDQLTFQMPLFKKLGNQVQLKVTSLRPYESFANDMLKSIDPPKEPFEHKNPVDRKGIFYWLRFDVEYKNMDMQDLFKIWVEEATSALGAKSKGVVFDLWKAVGERVVHAILCVDNPDMLDQITFNLPIMRKLGNQVHITVKSLRGYGAFRDDLEKLIEN